MNEKFLAQVAAYFCKDVDIDTLADLVLIVPSRRSGLFLKKHFQQVLAGRNRPVMLPRFHTMGRLIDELAQCRVMPHAEQLFVLYEAYCEILAEMGNDTQPRDFDRFVFWGEIILSDFNDIDSSLADASAVFRNLKGLKEIAADFLTDEQKEIVRKLWGETPYTATGDSFWLHLGNTPDESVVKTRFIQLWQLLAPLYERFHHKLTLRGMTTEGRRERIALATARQLSVFKRRFAFVGFSSLSNAEFAIMNALRVRDAAQFFWDFGMLPQATPVESVLKKLARLTKALPAPDDFTVAPARWPETIECIAVPSNTGQAKYISMALRNWYSPQENRSHDEVLLDTAIVVPDESLLQSMVLSLPPQVDAVNISLMLPYRNSGFASLLSAIISMQLRARKIHDEYHFYFEDLERLLTHPHMRAIAPEFSRRLLHSIVDEKAYNISASELQAQAAALACIFRPVKDLGDISEIHGFMTDLLDCMEENFRRLNDNARLIEYRMLEFFRTQLGELYRLIIKYGVSMGENTYFVLFERLLSAKRIDLHGSPLRGLQMMGVLETRALDFNRLIIASMNERIFPRRSYLRTMIPDSLRRAYGLNTQADAEDAYTYYFYRLITGAGKVKLLYDNRPASLGGGEVSRFISQIRYLPADTDVRFTSIRLDSHNSDSTPVSITKNDAIVRMLDEYRAGGKRYFSASMLKTYLTCPLKFYLKNIRHIDEEDSVNPYLEASDYGTVVHSVMERLYSPYRGMEITREIIDKMLNSKGHVENIVRDEMTTYLSRDRIRRGLRPRPLNTESQILCRVICHFVVKVLEAERNSLCPFRYEAAEQEFKSPPDWEISPQLKIRFKMYIDRIDSITPGRLRFIDYKTGSDQLESNDFARIFSDYNQMAIFQLLLYCEAYGAMIDSNVDIQPVIYNFLNISAVEKIEPIRINGNVVYNYKDYSSEFMPLLRKTIEEIFDVNVPFAQCENTANCSYCPFKELCDR